MLDGLDEVDWKRLTHAYGTAEDTPSLIRQLLDAEATVRQKALSHLEFTIYHQGSRYRASAPTVPFLFEVLEDPETQEKAGMIALLSLLAVGYPEYHLPFGFDPVQEFADVALLGSEEAIAAIRDGEPEEEDDWEEGRQALWKRDAYDAVRKRLDVIRKFTIHPDTSVRMAAIKALAWFPEDSAESLPLVRQAAQASTTEEERVNALYAFGILGRSHPKTVDVSWLPPLLASEQPSSPVRVGAAVALGTLLEERRPSEALNVLLEAVQAVEAEPQFAWHWRGRIAQVADLLAALRPEPTEETLTALCRAAEIAPDYVRANVFRALLAAVFPVPTQTQFVEDPTIPSGTRLIYLDPTTLSETQWEAVQAIRRNAIWAKTHLGGDEVMDVFFAFGLPYHLEKFPKFLESARH